MLFIIKILRMAKHSRLHYWEEKNLSKLLDQVSRQTPFISESILGNQQFCCRWYITSAALLVELLWRHA